MLAPVQYVQQPRWSFRVDGPSISERVRHYEPLRGDTLPVKGVLDYPLDDPL